ncbi:hypothetical protein GLOIN_2v1487921 [Rhizophagus clarus]|uniref:Uncharacterized protein n=1 Tax=Rhizophagus clarus TaxID=94130 RepID=A0A8H3L4B7_9GLOM|nr:hypothetical protein GLOIN_2v1487921 [Rhizophagus clarus]
MPPIKKTREISQEPCLMSSMLIKVFTFLNSNFDMWTKDSYGACNKAKETTKITWDVKTTLNIVNSCIEVTEEYIRTGNKSSSCNAIIWNNKMLNGLIGRFCYKITKRVESQQETMEDLMNDDGIENILSTDQVVTETFVSQKDTSFSVKEFNKLYNKKVKNVNHLATKSKEEIEDTRKKQVEEIFQLWSKLEKTIEDESFLEILY